MVAADLLPSLEGVELGSYGKVNVRHLVRSRNRPITHHTSVCLLNVSISDGVLCSVSLSNQCLGENKERQRCRELHSSDASSVPFPSQRAAELHPCSSEQQRSAGSMYVFRLSDTRLHHRLTKLISFHSGFWVFQLWRR